MRRAKSTTPRRRARCLGLCMVAFMVALACLPAAAQPEPPTLRFVAPTNHAMPMAGFEGRRLTDGMLKDLGELLAQRLGREARFVPMPSKRVARALADGEADAVCYVMRGWIEGDLAWSRAFIPESQVIAASLGAPALSQLRDLAGATVGTVIAYRYPEIEAVVKPPIARTDVSDMQTNLRRLAAGRVPYAVAERGAVDYYRRQHPEAKISIALTVHRYQAGCAFSAHAKLPIAQVNRAIDDLIRDGAVERIQARYR